MGIFRKVILTTASVGLAISMLTGCTDSQWASYSNAPEQGYAYGTAADGIPAFMGKNGKLTTGSKDVQDTFYFAFDRSDLDQHAKSELRTHARWLLKNPAAKVRIEGHTDERGSREYNVALGERRAKSVARELFGEGVKGDQVAIVSYGEEKPAVQGHSESAWKWNRRGQVAYELG
jgi:peptidoglycan-associated lipoprotein